VRAWSVPPVPPNSAFVEAVTLANNEILRAAFQQPEWKGMACVLTLAMLENGHAIIGHVGDRAST